MVVDREGRAYVGEVGFDVVGGAALKTAALVLVTPDGRARVAASELAAPNGAVITADGHIADRRRDARRLR